MEAPASPGETPKKKKKRNPSFRRYLGNNGIEVPPVVQGQRDPSFPLKRKRNQRRPGKKGAKKRKAAAAAAAASATNDESDSDSGSSDAVSPAAVSPSLAGSPSLIAVLSPTATTLPAATSPPVVSPSNTAVPSPAVSSSHTAVSSLTRTLDKSSSRSADIPDVLRAEAETSLASQSAPEETESVKAVWDPVDPLGLFDELEGPLDWPSEGLFD
ncbi:unnamed protein product [Penicillium glandicola]